MRAERRELASKAEIETILGYYPASDRERLRKEIFSARSFHAKYHVPKSVFWEMVTEQHRKCAICHRVKDLVMDHDHKTGKIRRPLCPACNAALGLIRENERVLVSMIGYLRRNGRLTDEEIKSISEEKAFTEMVSLKLRKGVELTPEEDMRLADILDP